MTKEEKAKALALLERIRKAVPTAKLKTPKQAEKLLYRFEMLGVDAETALLSPDEIELQIHNLQRALQVSQKRQRELDEFKSQRVKVKRPGRVSYCEYDKIPKWLIEANSQGDKVYVIRGVGTKNYKIGYSRNPLHKRIDELALGSAVDLELVGYGRGTQSLERKLHKWLKFYRRRGEWFELPDRVLWWLLGYLKQISKETSLRLISSNSDHNVMVARQRMRPRHHRARIDYLIDRAERKIYGAA